MNLSIVRSAHSAHAIPCARPYKSAKCVQARVLILSALQRCRAAAAPLVAFSLLHIREPWPAAASSACMFPGYNIMRAAILSLYSGAHAGLYCGGYIYILDSPPREIKRARGAALQLARASVSFRRGPHQ